MSEIHDLNKSHTCYIDSVTLLVKSHDKKLLELAETNKWIQGSPFLLQNPSEILKIVRPVKWNICDITGAAVNQPDPKRTIGAEYVQEEVP